MGVLARRRHDLKRGGLGRQVGAGEREQERAQVGDVLIVERGKLADRHVARERIDGAVVQ